MRCHARNFNSQNFSSQNCTGSFDECNTNITCESSCYLLWEHNGTRISAGCGLPQEPKHEDHCSPTCVAVKRSARYYCCCLGDLCNYNYTVPESLLASSNPSNTSAQPIVTHGGTSARPWPTTTALSVLFVVVVAALGLLIMYNRRRSKKDSFGNHISEEDYHLNQQTMPMMTRPQLNEAHIRNHNNNTIINNNNQHHYYHNGRAETDLNSAKIDLNSVKLLEVLGQGRFGIVHRAYINDVVEVAVKVIKGQEFESYQNERYVFKSHMIRHPNILSYLYSEEHIESRSYWLIVEYAPRGSLCSYIKDNTIKWEDFLQMLLGVVRGLSHLHDSYIAHRDFKSTNILLKQDLTPCITDFGVAKLFDSPNVSQLDKKYHQVGTPRYMAPEVLECNILFTMGSILKIDVYALSLVLWELLSRTTLPTLPTLRGYIPTEFVLPFENEAGLKPSIERMVQIVVHEKRRPPIRQEWTTHERLGDFCKSVLMEAWDADSDSRISASCILERVTTFVDRENTILNYQQL